MRATLPAATLAAVAAVTSLPPAAAGAPRCPDAPVARPLLDGQGVLESVIADGRGRLLYTDTTRGAVLRLDGPADRAPEVVAAGIEAPGGLALLPGGGVIVGEGDAVATGVQGSLGTPMARLLRFDGDAPAPAPVSLFAGPVQMANGVVRAADGTVYASSDVGTGIDRVAPDGTVTLNWARVSSPNGLAISPDGRFLYANQTFQPAAVARIEIAGPARVETYAQAAAADLIAAPGGLEIDQDGRLFVAANAAGEVWRIGTDRKICALTTALTTVSAVAFGTGATRGGFPATSLFAVTFAGRVVELPGVRAAPAGGAGTVQSPAGPPRGVRYSLSVTPRRVRLGRRVRFTLRARRTIGTRRLPAPRARLRFAGRVLRTDTTGRVRVTLRLRRTGRVVARYASRTGAGSAAVTVRAASPRRAAAGG